MRFIEEYDTGEDLCLRSLSAPSALTLTCILYPSADRPSQANGLVDTGCSDFAFINESLVHRLQLPIKPLSQPRRIRLADGDNCPNFVTHLAFSHTSIGGHYEPLVYLVAKLGSDIILGYPWLQRHNPNIDFSTSTICFQSAYCLSYCLPSGVPELLRGKIDRLPSPTSNYQSPTVQDVVDEGEQKLATSVNRTLSLSSEPGQKTSPLDQSQYPDLIHTIDSVVQPISQPQEIGFRLLTKEEAHQRLHPPKPQPVLFIAGHRRHLRRYLPRTPQQQTLHIKAVDREPNAPIRIRLLSAAPMATFCRQKDATAQWTTLQDLLTNTPKVFYIDPLGRGHHTPEEGIFHPVPAKRYHDIPSDICQAILTDTIDLDRAKAEVHPDLHDFLTDHYSLIHLNKITEADIRTFHEKQQRQPYTADQLRSRVPSQYHDLLDVFLKQKADELPPHRPFDTKIHLKENAQPPYYKSRPFSSHEQTVIKAYLDELLDKGFIRRSTSSAAAPVLLAKKPGGGIRICVDYRGLNEVTVRNRFPLPLVHDTLEKMRHAKFFTKLDVIAAFNKIRIAEGDEWKTAFITRYGLYEYLVTPFGLTNAPAYFQDFINSTLHDILDEYCSAYLDDVIIYSKTREEHNRHVREVLQRLRAAGLQIDIDKCEFSVSKTKYLGLIVETDASDWASGGVLSQRGDDGFLHPIAYFSSKHSAQECNYEIYDKELLAIIKSLEEWRPELEGLDHFDIITDHQNLKYFMTTKLLNQRQARWAEFLSRFNFTIKYQPGKQADKPDALSRLPGTRPASLTDATDDRISHRYQTILPESKLDSNIALTACSLSLYGLGDEPIDDIIDRIYSTSGLIAEMTRILQLGLKKVWPKSLRSELRHLPLQKCKVIRNRIYYEGRLFVPQSDETALQLIYHFHNTSAAGHPGRAKTAELVRRTYIWPRMHLDIARYIRNCHQCIRSKSSRSLPQGFLQPLEVPLRAWRDISIDYVTGLPECKRNGRTYRHILVVVDRLTKMKHFIATETLETEELVEAFISRVWSLHGTPETIISDRGTQFVSGIWRQLSKRLGTTLKPSSAHHPETDGQTEISNAAMEVYLRNYTSYLQDDWSDWLPFAEFAVNNATSESIGISPFFANYGYHPRLGVEPIVGPLPPMTPQQRKEYLSGEAIADKFDRITKQIRTAMAEAQEKQAFYANQKRIEAPPYRVGDYVFITTKNLRTDRPSRKLDTKREGPFRIVKTYRSTVALDMGNSRVTPLFHHSKLTKAPKDPLPGQEALNKRPEDEGVLVRTEEGEENREWRFERILAQRSYKDGSIKFKIQWTNSRPTWQPADDVIGCWSDLDDWYTANPDEIRPQFYLDYLEKKKKAEQYPKKKKKVRFNI